MPTYEFYNTETNEFFELLMRISEKEKYLLENPHIQSIISAPNIVSGVSISGKVPDGFKDVLSKVAENHPDSNVGKRYGKKSIKDIKKQQIVDKHVKKITKKINDI